MSINENRLGKGLEALIPRNIISETGNRFDTVKIQSIKKNPFQPRQKFNEESIQTLSESIKEHGLTQPIIVRERDDYYEIIAGERRLRASILAGLEKIDVIIKNISDSDSIKMALIENLEREDLNPIEIAESYHKMLKEFQFTHDDIANIVKRKRSSVTNSLRLLKLPDSIKELLKNKKLSEGHAKILVGIPNEEEQLRLCDQIINQRLNVRQTEQKKAEKKTVKLSPEINELQHRLTKRFQTNAKVTGTKSKGKITLNYKSEEELDLLLRVLMP